MCTPGKTDIPPNTYEKAIADLNAAIAKYRRESDTLPAESDIPTQTTPNTYVPRVLPHNSSYRDNTYDPRQTDLIRAIRAHREIHLEGLRTWAITEFTIAMRKASEFNAKQAEADIEDDWADISEIDLDRPWE